MSDGSATRSAPVCEMSQTSASDRDAPVATEKALARFAVGPLSLSDEDAGIGRRNLLETVVLGIAGVDGPGVASIEQLARAECAAGPATVWRGGPSLAPSGAAMVNAAATSALDGDTLYGSVHADAVIVPVVLAVGEAVGASGVGVLSAHAVGCEVMCRLSEAATPPQRGWTHTSLYGVFGAAAATARLLGYSEAQAAQALGIALSLAAGSQQTNIDRALTKRLQPGLAARHGIFAAAAVGHGVTGATNWLTGRGGLWSLYQGGEPSRLLEGLGASFLFPRAIQKVYPVCSCSHAAMSALADLMAKHGLVGHEIDRIAVTITPFMNHMVGGGFDPSENPVVAAQFSLEYGLACMALRGKCDLADLDVDRVRDPEIAAFCNRIEISVDTSQTGELTPAVVEVSTRQGRFSGSCDTMPGSPERPMTGAEFTEKLVDCLAQRNKGRAQRNLARLSDAVEALIEMPTVRDLNGLIAAIANEGK